MKIIVLWLIFWSFIPYDTQAEAIQMVLEHAITPEAKEIGLMGRSALLPNHGMTFTYSKPQRVSIWMYNVLIDLSLAFLDENKIIREIHELQAYPDNHSKNFFRKKSITSSFSVSFALEMPKGWFAANGIKMEDQAVWDNDQSIGYIIKKETVSR